MTPIQQREANRLREFYFTNNCRKKRDCTKNIITGENILILITVVVIMVIMQLIIDFFRLD